VYLHEAKSFLQPHPLPDPPLLKNCLYITSLPAAYSHAKARRRKGAVYEFTTPLKKARHSSLPPRPKSLRGQALRRTVCISLPVAYSHAKARRREGAKARSCGEERLFYKAPQSYPLPFFRTVSISHLFLQLILTRRREEKPFSRGDAETRRFYLTRRREDAKTRRREDAKKRLSRKGHNPIPSPSKGRVREGMGLKLTFASRPRLRMRKTHRGGDVFGRFGKI
jgi:hypothetical protein